MIGSSWKFEEIFWSYILADDIFTFFNYIYHCENISSTASMMRKLLIRLPFLFFMVFFKYRCILSVQILLIAVQNNHFQSLELI